MIADKFYKHLRDYESQPATWAIRKIFEQHANKLRQRPQMRASMMTALSEAADADRCAEIMRRIGAERFSLLRKWVPVTMPESLDIHSIGDFRHTLEDILAWKKKHGPKPD